MSNRRGRRESISDLLPTDIDWCRKTWADRVNVAKLDGGAWMLRHCADRLGIDQSVVDELIRHHAQG